MNVSYKCACMASETTIAVPDRREGSDTVKYVEMIQVCVGLDHAMLSPLCIAPKCEYIKIPIQDENKGIGYAATKN